MSLRDRLGKVVGQATDKRQKLFDKFGVMRNPYPPAGEPTGHPHLETATEEPIVKAIEAFDRDHVSQVLLVEGTQGVGKTNLLNYFQRELTSVYKDATGYYIIRYYPDPESTFDGILRRIFQEFDSHNLLARLGEHLNNLDEDVRETKISIASGHEMRILLRALTRASEMDEDFRLETAKAALDWLTGLRILKKHKELLGVSFRLDTIESKTQALRDLVFCCSEAKLLSGFFLLLDELEKQDYSYSKTVVLRYLSAIRALIDALPKHLFLLVALTIEARRRYFLWLPAFAGRLQNIVSLKPMTDANQALNLSNFYLEQARDEGRREFGRSKNVVDIIPAPEVKKLFTDLYEEAANEKAQEGVTARDFLQALNARTESIFEKI